MGLKAESVEGWFINPHFLVLQLFYVVAPPYLPGISYYSYNSCFNPAHLYYEKNSFAR